MRIRFTVCVCVVHCTEVLFFPVAYGIPKRTVPALASAIVPYQLLPKSKMIQFFLVPVTGLHRYRSITIYEYRHIYIAGYSLGYGNKADTVCRTRVKVRFKYVSVCGVSGASIMGLNCGGSDGDGGWNINGNQLVPSTYISIYRDIRISSRIPISING